MKPRVKRKKTFTGCWTCRSRKIKCDGQKPSCERCQKANLKCDGYDIRLRWSPVITGDAGEGSWSSTGKTTGTNPDEEQYFQRRSVGMFYNWKNL